MADRKPATLLLRILLKVFGGLVAAVGVAALLLLAFFPTVARHVDWPEVTVDLAPYLPDCYLARFTNTTARIRFTVGPGDRHDLAVRMSGRLFDWPLEGRAEVDYSVLSWRLGGRARFHVPESPWRATADFSARGLSDWTVDLTVPPIEFNERDGVSRRCLDPFLSADDETLSYGGVLGCHARAETYRGHPVVRWDFASDVSDLHASWGDGENPRDVRNLRLKAKAKGFGPLVDISPLVPMADEVEIGALRLTNAYAAVRFLDSGLLVSEAGARIWGGQAKAYSLYLDREHQTAGANAYLDNIDAEQAINLLRGFQGRATGRLYGKIPLRMKDGELVLSSGYLHSKPGEEGRLQLDSAKPLIDSLRASGASESECDNLARVLRDMTYTVLRLELERETEKVHVLRFRLEGHATAKKVTVPVSLSVNIRGGLEQLLNTTINVHQKGKLP